MKKLSFLLFLLIIIIITPPVFAAKGWIDANPAVSPEGRRVYSISYIGSDRVLLFGGVGDELGNETWVYDVSDNTWTNMNPGTWISGTDVPEPRRWQGMAYIGDDKALLFGGMTGTSSASYTNDTWIYDYSDNAWTKIAPT